MKPERRFRRWRAYLPAGLVGAVAIATVATIASRPDAAADGTDVSASTIVASTAGGRGPARSSAAMLAEEPLPALLADPDRVRAERLRYLGSLARRHATEARDPIGGDAAEQALRGIAASEALVATGIVPERWSSDCRSRSCRIEAAFADFDDAQDWANYFLTGSGATLAQAELSIQRGADAMTHVLILGARR